MSSQAADRHAHADPAVAPPPAPGFAEALLYWLRLGCISFGGPAGQIAIMHQDLVERRRWIGESRFLHALNYCMVLPGPEAQQLATYIGWLLHGTRGGIAAGVLFVLPSVFVLILLSWIYMTWGQVPAVAAVLWGIKPAVTAIVAFAAWRIGSRALKNAALWTIAVAALLGIAVFGLPFPLIVLGAGLLGALGGRVAPHWFRGGGGHGGGGKSYGAALIDEHTPTPAHARYSRPRLLRLALGGLVLWGGVLILLALAFGAGGTPVQMGTFFTKAALLTFGGAYAVLPYVYQGAVEHYGWLAPAQMIDGLALGETTPGPLIMVVAFVGYVGAWTKQVFGPDALAAAGALGALVATWFTFLPSFLFILIGGPWVEATRGDIKFTAPLTAITAAVVGVIVSLALFFAGHVLWPDGPGGRFEWLAVLLGLAAGYALFRQRAGVIPVLAACAAAGLLLSFAGALH